MNVGHAEGAEFGTARGRFGCDRLPGTVPEMLCTKLKG